MIDGTDENMKKKHMKKIRQYLSLPHVRPYPFKFILASLSPDSERSPGSKRPLDERSKFETADATERVLGYGSGDRR